ncbi:hypothetical protein V8J36_09780 [Frigidibacter sp. MR17.14]
MSKTETSKPDPQPQQQGSAAPRPQADGQTSAPTQMGAPTQFTDWASI